MSIVNGAGTGESAHVEKRGHSIKSGKERRGERRPLVGGEGKMMDGGVDWRKEAVEEVGRR